MRLRSLQDARLRFRDDPHPDACLIGGTTQELRCFPREGQDPLVSVPPSLESKICPGDPPSTVSCWLDGRDVTSFSVHEGCVGSARVHESLRNVLRSFRGEGVPPDETDLVSHL